LRKRNSRILARLGFPAGRDLFRSELISGHRTLTDIYLLGLAVRQHGRLATFDGAVPWRPVVGAAARHMALID
jgi:hypothetical protein